MRDLAKTFSPMLWVIAFVLLIVRTGDAHLHLCFDGQEAPQTLHVVDDVANHHNGGAGQSTHTDTDVDAVDVGMTKKVSHTGDAVPLRLASLILFLLPPGRRIGTLAAVQDPPPRHPYLFLPQLRGPPA